jgi:hypothetical protein
VEFKRFYNALRVAIVLHPQVLVSWKSFLKVVLLYPFDDINPAAGLSPRYNCFVKVEGDC